MDSDQLATLLADPPYQEAIGVLEMISKNPEDLQFYEARLKFLRDQHSQIEAAKQEAQNARAEGLEEGREQGLEEGREQGRPALVASVRLFEELIGDPVTPAETLMTLDFETLTAKATELQQRLRSRKP